MGYIIFLIVSVLLLLGLERLFILTATKSESGVRWIRQCYLLHPNVISTLRIPMGILSICVWHYGFSAKNTMIMVIGLLWFAAWMISDLTDGTIARRCQLWTAKGEWLDPLSDKFMYFPALLYFSFIPGIGANGGEVLYLSRSLVLGILVFDTIGQVSRLWFKKKAANTFGKAKTALITTLLTLVALLQIFYVSGNTLPEFIKPETMFYYLTLCAFMLSFLSVYCKMIPDNWYANSLTLANFCCGVGAIILCVSSVYETTPSTCLFKAFLLVFLGQFFDLFDGRLARKYGSTRWGAIFDDIADGTNFGLAIGAIASTSAYNILSASNMTISQYALHCSIGLFVFYCGCVFYRLYRFLFPTREVKPGVFQGLPSPAGAMLAGSGILLFSAEPVLFDGSAFFGIAIVVLASLLMISNIPYKHLGQRILVNLPRGIQVLFFLLIIIFASFSLSFSRGRHEWYQFAFECFSLLVILFYLGYGIDYRELFGKKENNEEIKE